MPIVGKMPIDVNVFAKTESVTITLLLHSRCFQDSDEYDKRAALHYHFHVEKLHCKVRPSFGINEASTLNFLLQDGHVIIM